MQTTIWPIKEHHWPKGNTLSISPSKEWLAGLYEVQEKVIKSNLVLLCYVNLQQSSLPTILFQGEREEGRRWRETRRNRWFAIKSTQVQCLSITILDMLQVSMHTHIPLPLAYNLKKKKSSNPSVYVERLLNISVNYHDYNELSLMFILLLLV